jgi:hypothetical protein
MKFQRFRIAYPLLVHNILLNTLISHTLSLSLGSEPSFTYMYSPVVPVLSVPSLLLQATESYEVKILLS